MRLARVEGAVTSTSTSTLTGVCSKVALPMPALSVLTPSARIIESTACEAEPTHSPEFTAMSRLISLLAGLVFMAPVVQAQDLEPIAVAVGLSIPPYVIADERRGMEYDIVRDALADAGYEMEPVFMELGAVPKALARGDVDAAMTVRPDAELGAALSEVAIIYHNQAMTLADRGIAIDTIEDLADHSIMAFQNARIYLPDPYRAIADGNPAYSEVAEQHRQNLALFMGEVEVVVADINIFNWFTDDPRVTSMADSRQPVTRHAIFPPTSYRVGFRDEATRDAFDVALAALRASGRYDAIIESYGGTP